MTLTNRDLKDEFSEQKPLSVQVAAARKMGKVPYIAFDPSSSFIIAGHGKTICIFDCQGTFRKEINMHSWDKHEIQAVGIDAIGEHIVVVNTANCIQKWSIGSCALVDNYDFDKSRLSLSHLLKFVGNGNFKIVWDNSANFSSFFIVLGNGFLVPKPIRIKSIGLVSAVDVIHLKTNEVFKLDLIDDDVCVKWNAHDISSNNFLAASVSETIFIFDINTGKKLKTLDGHAGRVTCVSFSPDNRFIISGSDDKTIRIWDVGTGNLLKVLNAHSEGVLSVAISPNGRHLACGDAGGHMLLWDFSKLMQSLEKSKKHVYKEKNEGGLFKIFSDILKDPELLSTDLLLKMFKDVQSLEEFKLPYTLANIELRQCAEHKDRGEIQKSIYKCLKKLASTCPSTDSSKEGSDYVAQYKLALDAVFKGELISKKQRYHLAHLAAKNSTFSDERFVSLQHAAQALKERIKAVEHDILAVAQNLNALKEALKTKTQRDFIFAIVKIGVGFMAGPVIDFFSHVFDLSDVAALGNAVLKIDAEGWDKLIKKGSEAVKANLDSVVEKAMIAAGYDPKALIDAWIDATVKLEIVAPSANPCSFLTAAAPLSALVVGSEVKDPERKEVNMKITHELDVEAKTIEKQCTDRLSVALREHAEHKGTHATVFAILAQAQSALIAEDKKRSEEQHAKEKFNKKYQESDAADPHLAAVYQRRARLAQTRLELFKTVIASGFSVSDIKKQINNFSSRLDRSLKKFYKSGLDIYGSTPQKQAYKKAIAVVAETVKGFKAS